MTIRPYILVTVLRVTSGEVIVFKSRMRHSQWLQLSTVKYSKLNTLKLTNYSSYRVVPNNCTISANCFLLKDFNNTLTADFGSTGIRT